MSVRSPTSHGDKALYRPPAVPVLVDVPGLDFALVDGSGDPNTSPDYRQALAALYAFSYPVVITLKRLGRLGLKVGPLEGQWSADDMNAFGTAGDRTTWRWTMMIRQPEGIPDDVLTRARAKVIAKVGRSAASSLRIERFDEGRCAQVMHHGPYADEGHTIERLHAFIAEQGMQLRGRHHEIYLSDPRRTVPAAMKTVLRQPVTG
jgi:hypothetical protein